jgi:hypothetical protein
LRYRVNRSVIQRWREQEGRSFAWLSRQVGIKPDTLHQQIRGTCGLSLGVALALEKATGIPLQSLVEQVREGETLADVAG